MKCQILFSRKNKQNIISLLSAESAHGVVSVNTLMSCLIALSEMHFFSNSLSELTLNFRIYSVQFFIHSRLTKL